MNRLHYFLLTLGLFVFQPSFALDFFFDYSTFYVPGNQTYVETYLAIPANTLNLQSHPDFSLSGSAEITITFSQDGEIRQFDKYLLKSPMLTDSTVNNTQLLDTKRFELSPGSYLVELSLLDTKDTVAVSYSELIEVEAFDDETTGLSHISLLDSYRPLEEENGFTKNGVEMLPRVFPFYGDNMPSIQFYCEAYGTNQLDSETHLLNYFLTRKGKNKVVSNKRRFKKQKGELVNIIFGELDITDLASGNYDLVVEIRNQKNELVVSRRKTFQRYNKYAQTLPLTEADLEGVVVSNSFVDGLNKGDLMLYVGALEPLLRTHDVPLLDRILEAGNQADLKKYLYNFWMVNAPQDPEREFTEYVQIVNLVENRFGTNRIKGYKTDRGWTYLKYGKPSEKKIQGNFNPGALPYEIWEYYTVPNGQRNVIFVFYNPNFATNEYTLLHSTVRGEIQEPRWKKILYREIGEDDFNMDNNNVEDIFGNGF